MNRRTGLTTAALVVAFLAGGAMAHAQGITADIGFPFVAGGKTMAAGRYTIERAPNGPAVLTAPGGDQTMMPVITTLGRHDQDRDPEFVFDKVDGKMMLSEIWMPGRDGLLVLATKTSHEHAVVGGSNPRK